MNATTANRPLTHRQQRFVEEYLVDLNGTQAAIRAGYSPATAKFPTLVNAAIRRRRFNEPAL